MISLLVGCALVSLPLALLWLLQPARPAPPSLAGWVRLRGRIVGPGAADEVVLRRGEIRGFMRVAPLLEIEAGAQRTAVIAHGATTDASCLLVGDRVEVDGRAVWLQRDEHLHRDLACQPAIEATRITSAPRSRPLQVVGSAALLLAVLSTLALVVVASHSRHDVCIGPRVDDRRLCNPTDFSRAFQPE